MWFSIAYRIHITQEWRNSCGKYRYSYNRITYIQSAWDLPSKQTLKTKWDRKKFSSNTLSQTLVLIRSWSQSWDEVLWTIASIFTFFHIVKGSEKKFRFCFRRNQLIVSNKMADIQWCMASQTSKACWEMKWTIQVKLFHCLQDRFRLQTTKYDDWISYFK